MYVLSMQQNFYIHSIRKKGLTSVCFGNGTISSKQSHAVGKQRCDHICYIVITCVAEPF
jgi:hypothetical protein